MLRKDPGSNLTRTWTTSRPGYRDRAAEDREILKFVAVGRANKEIGQLLSVSEDTVKAHMKSIFSKLGVADRTLAVTIAVKRGLIEI